MPEGETGPQAAGSQLPKRPGPSSQKGEFSLMMAGVGGQGLVLLSSIIGSAGALSNMRVVTGEQHGLSQRSGSIQVHLRIGPGVRSPLIPVGSADALLSLEALETLRYIEYLRDGGVAIINSRVMHPVTETSELVRDRKAPQKYLGLEEVVRRLETVTPHVLTLDALELANRAGNPLTENVVLLGAMCVLEAFPIPPEPLRDAIRRMVPAKAVEANLRAFEVGARAARERFCRALACRAL
ncbi:MAG: indolepyruvate oxidoreductase subunit beta [Thermoplasmata archaeon]